MGPVRATRYVAPLREGGSLPGLMEADDLGTYVVKFRGAGQGPRALVAEVICAALATAAGLPVPRWVPIEVPPELSRSEPDQEIQHLLRVSAGLNLGVDFLPGALDVGPRPAVDPALAGRILWFDALIGNMDRSWRNPNMLTWHRTIYLIDHGAALTFHHSWDQTRDLPGSVARFAQSVPQVQDHALVECRPDIGAADAALSSVPWPDELRAAVAAVPDQWLDEQPGGPQGARSRYVDFLTARLDARHVWVPALADAVDRGAARDERGHRATARTSTGPPAWLRELRLGDGSPP